MFISYLHSFENSLFISNTRCYWVVFFFDSLVLSSFSILNINSLPAAWPKDILFYSVGFLFTGVVLSCFFFFFFSFFLSFFFFFFFETKILCVVLAFVKLAL
jgi:hypothetical protein